MPTSPAELRRKGETMLQHTQSIAISVSAMLAETSVPHSRLWHWDAEIERQFDRLNVVMQGLIVSDGPTAVQTAAQAAIPSIALPDVLTFDAQGNVTGGVFPAAQAQGQAVRDWLRTNVTLTAPTWNARTPGGVTEPTFDVAGATEWRALLTDWLATMRQIAG